MSLIGYKITDRQVAEKGVSAAPDVLNGTAAENKAVFDRLTKQIVKEQFNALIDELVGGSGAGNIGVSAISGLEGKNVQAVLEELKMQLGYIGSKQVLSRIACDGVKDDVSTLAYDLNNLPAGSYYKTPAGVSRLSDGKKATVENCILDFTGTTFQLDPEASVMIFKLKNCIVKGLHFKSSREGFDDASATQYGTQYLFKLSTDSSNVIFYDTTLEDAPYCAIMLGGGLSNIRFVGLNASAIGEHIMYCTGGSEGDLDGIEIDTAHLQYGINRANKTYSHPSNIIKHAGGTGKVSNVTLKNVDVLDSSGDTACALEALTLENIKIDSCVLKSVFNGPSNPSGQEVIASTISNSKIGRGICYTVRGPQYDCIVRNSTLTYLVHANAVKLYKDCVLTYANADEGNEMDFTFDGCAFSSISSFSLRGRNISMLNCNIDGTTNDFPVTASGVLRMCNVTVTGVNKMTSRSTKTILNGCTFAGSYFSKPVDADHTTLINGCIFPKTTSQISKFNVLYDKIRNSIYDDGTDINLT